MKKYQEEILRVILVVGLLAGCFPSKNLFQSSQELKFEWWSLPVIYTFVFAALEIAVQIDFLVARTEEYARVFFPTTIMMEFGQFGVSLLADLLRRLISVHTCKKIINLMKLHKEIKIDANYSYRFHCNYSYWIVILCALFCFIQNCLLIVVHFTEQPEEVFPLLPITNACFSVFLETLGAICSIFGLTITILFSQEGLFGFECICEEFKSSFLELPSTFSYPPLMSDFRKTENTPKSFICSVLVKGSSPTHFQSMYHLASINSRLVKMRRIFEEFNAVSGVYILTLLLQSTFQFIYYGFGTLYRDEHYLKLMSIAGLLSSTTLMFTILHQGNRVKSRIGRQKKDIQEAMLLIKCTEDKHDLVKATGNFICNWKSELSAMTFFEVDYQLFPKIIGIMMTYIIFLFQLKLAEHGIACPRSNVP